MSTYNYFCKNKNSDINNPTVCEFCDRRGSLQIKISEEDQVHTEGSIFSTPKDEYVCPYDKSTSLKMMGVSLSPMKFHKLTSDEIKKDRQARSTAHFKKEVFPTLGVDEQRHFIKKHTDLKPTISLKSRDLRAEGHV